MIGLIERFGYGLSTDDVEPEDYVARVQQVIDSNNLLVYIASVGYRCIVDSSEIVGIASEDQLTDEDKKEEKSLFSFLAEPQFVYINDEEVPDGSIAEKCDYLAKKAMVALFPESVIVRSYFNGSDYIKADLLARVDTFIKEELFDNKNFFEALKKKRDYFEDMLQHLRFKEYYTVNLGVQDEDDENITNFLMIAVDTVFEQVVITTDIDERTKFFYSLGPDYDSVYRFYSDFIKEATTQETVIKIDI